MQKNEQKGMWGLEESATNGELDLAVENSSLGAEKYVVTWHATLSGL